MKLGLTPSHVSHQTNGELVIYWGDGTTNAVIGKGRAKNTWD
jgi:hypothetical protein